MMFKVLGLAGAAAIAVGAFAAAKSVRPMRRDGWKSFPGDEPVAEPRIRTSEPKCFAASSNSGEHEQNFRAAVGPMPEFRWGEGATSARRHADCMLVPANMDELQRSKMRSEGFAPSPRNKDVQTAQQDGFAYLTGGWPILVSSTYIAAAQGTSIAGAVFTDASGATVWRLMLLDPSESQSVEVSLVNPAQESAPVVLSHKDDSEASYIEVRRDASGKTVFGARGRRKAGENWDAAAQAMHATAMDYRAKFSLP